MLDETGSIPAEVDVVVLGGGIAGHAAALAAADAGASVLMLEKGAQAGGSSAMAGGAFAFSGTDMMIAAGQEDSLDAFRDDLFKSGKGKNNPALVDAFIAAQLDSYEFLRRHGVKFDLYEPVPRVHTTGTGRAITSLHMTLRANPNIQFFSKSPAMRLDRCRETGRVISVAAYYGGGEATVRVRCGVVLATGGFSRSREVLGTFAPELVEAVKHGGIANTGDGLMMAADLGAGMADLGYVTGSFGGGIRHYPEGSARSDEVPPLIFAFLDGAIMVNKEGRRFVNEGQSYKTLSSIGSEQTEGIGFQIFDQTLKDRSVSDTSVNNYDEAMLAGYLKSAPSISGLADLMGIDADILVATVERYNADVGDGVDREYGRTAKLMPIERAPFYIAATANAITSTYGGITADGRMAVLDWFGEPIPGLFAAGEVVGGFHGAGYYSASSLSSSATFGRLAGLAAAADN